MNENYQPVMIKTLLESPNYESTREQVMSKLREANQNEDRNWGMVFLDRINEQFSEAKKPDLVEYDEQKKVLSLIVDGKLSYEQKSRLIELCDEQIAKFNQSTIGTSSRKALEIATARILDRMIKRGIFES